jgi:hypothetical protein
MAKTVQELLQESINSLENYVQAYRGVAGACRNSERMLKDAGTVAAAVKCAEEAEVFEQLAGVCAKLKQDLASAPLEKHADLSLAAMEAEQVLWERLLVQRREVLTMVRRNYIATITGKTVEQSPNAH